MKIIQLCTVLIFLAATAQAQVVSDFNRVSVTLKDGTEVTLFGRAWDIGDKTQEEALRQGVLKDNLTAKDGHYFYLPTNLRLAKRKDGVPEFLLLKYIADEKTPDRDMSGALMHFLMEWGLSEAQKTECEELLRKAKPNEPQAKVMGAMKLFTPEGESFSITSATASDKGLTNTILSSGRAPLIEGGKIAVASNFNKYGAQLMGATLDKPSGKTSAADMSVTLRFRYQTKLPAFKGRVLIDWQKFAKNYLSVKDSQDVKRTEKDWGFSLPWFLGGWGHTQNKEVGNNFYSNKQTIFDSLSQSGVIIMEMEENYADERVNAIREAVLNLFTESITKIIEDYSERETEDPNARFDERAAAEREGLDTSRTRFRDRFKNMPYTTFSEINRQVYRKGSQRIELNYGLVTNNEFQITQNLLTWYNDAKKYNEACISKVILNDPFFQRLNIRFILDKDMVDIFEQEVNYATVNIRKKRGDGADFTSRVTLDKKFVQENGIQAAVTYAAGGDKNPDMYEYQVQYSFRGGNVFPKSPQWQRGAMEAVTLYPPIKMHNVEFESDLEQMKEYKIARATMQIRYRRLGEEFQANLPISPAKGQPITSKAVFMDKDMKGFAYRIIYDHKEEGKLATEWEAKLGAVDYLYATIPEAYQDKDSDLFKKAKELGNVLTPASSTEGKVVDIVLDAFKVLFE